MHHYRQVLTRMRLGETDRSIARAVIMGRRKVAELRQIALRNNWLDPDLPLPDDKDLTHHLQRRKDDNLQPSLVEPYGDEVLAWRKDGIQGTTIHATLVRKYGFQGTVHVCRNRAPSASTSAP